jgi:hypothetical protein
MAVAFSLGAALGAWGVTVDFYTSQGPDGSATGLNLAHAFISDGADDDRNGPNDFARTGATFSGDGMPDCVEVCLLEYLYATPGAPHHTLAMEAFDQNQQALVDWNNGVCAYPDGDGPGSTPEDPKYGPLFAFADFPYCDLFGDGITLPVCFAKCTPSNALLMEIAGYITTSEYALHADSKWHLLNYGEALNPSALLVNVDSDPAFNRSGVQVFGISGDIDGDGLTHLDEYRSVARAYIAARPNLAGVTPDTLWSMLGRAEKDNVIGRFIDIAAYVEGPDPGDPTPPSFGIADQSSDVWLEEGLDASVPLFVEAEHGVPPLSYQWYRDTTPLIDGPGVSGATASHLRVGLPLSLADSGAYTCRVEDSDGRVALSLPILVTVFETGSLPAFGAIGLATLAAALIGAARRRY